MAQNLMKGTLRRKIRPLVLTFGGMVILLCLASVLRFRRVHLDHVVSTIQDDAYAVACDVTNPYYYEVTVELEACASTTGRSGVRVYDEARHSLRVPARSTSRAEFEVPLEKDKYLHPLPRVYVKSVQRTDGIVTLR